MTQSGKSAAAVAAAIQEVYVSEAPQIAATLKHDGYSATKNGEALETILGLTNAQAGTLLREAGYPASEIAEFYNET